MGSSSDKLRAAEPRARRTIFVGFRKAAIQLWGEPGLAEIGQIMPEEVRAATVDNVVVVGEWQPERYVMAWYDAVMTGPAKGDRAVFTKFIDRMMDAGFGTVRKLLLQLASPDQVAAQAADLWRHDHTHGVLTPKKLDDQTQLFVLKDHPYTTTVLGRFAVTEICRYATELTRVKNVTAWHAIHGDELHVTVKYSR
ncbi:hypothetical protein AKJ09_03068 [Labilithrix luteola]|uniref:Uncharacterized protein n=1 Tax=Labilithrix luteola TaxID=1391654 RepID=A0A0K1PTE4_9BACT|nr:hypothetical protein [Labilithrix luteola]AKU96404.1 hypothetical protein AKJ09_03068 [Labilithrix luteola]